MIWMLKKYLILCTIWWLFYAPTKWNLIIQRNTSLLLISITWISVKYLIQEFMLALLNCHCILVVLQIKILSPMPQVYGLYGLLLRHFCLNMQLKKSYFLTTWHLYWTLLTKTNFNNDMEARSLTFNKENIGHLYHQKDV